MASVVLHGYDQVKAKGQIRLFRSHRDGIAHGHQSRDFVDVSDTVEAMWFALKRPIPGGIFNVGTGKARTFLDLAKAVFASLGVEERIEFVDTPPGIRDRYQYFTEAKMDRLRAQGFAKKPVALEDGVDWYVRRLESERA
jgi:ADP-L-glycero-D-manno-heptose 6-epimerase